jgi:hypothetical protein
MLVSLAALDSTIVAIAVISMIEDLGGARYDWVHDGIGGAVTVLLFLSFSLYSWVGAAYLLTAACFAPRVSILTRARLILDHLLKQGSHPLDSLRQNGGCARTSVCGLFCSRHLLVRVRARHPIFTQLVTCLCTDFHLTTYDGKLPHLRRCK